MSPDQFFKAITEQLTSDLPFVAYRKPDTTLVKGILQQNKTLFTISDFVEEGFVFAPFDSNEKSILIPLSEAHLISTPFDPAPLIAENEKDAPLEFENPNLEADRQLHIQRVKKGIEAIKKGCFSKVVLSRRERLSTISTHPVQIFKRLLQKYPTAFVYLWYHPKVGLWLGATPETLLGMWGNQLKTMALAGTQAYGGTTEVTWKSKEIEEQQIVTNFIIESLEAAIGPYQELNGKLTVSGPKTVRAGNLLHLLTEIDLRLSAEAKRLKPILEALHPTPAVCGYPKERSKAYIIEHEGYGREFYSGFLGELNLKESLSRNTNRRNVENNAYRIQKSVTNLYVNLRCMQIKNKELYIYIGGGILIDSDAEAEWLETIHKSKTIKSVL